MEIVALTRSSSIGLALGFALSSFALDLWPADAFLSKVAFMASCGFVGGGVGYVAPSLLRILRTRR